MLTHLRIDRWSNAAPWPPAEIQRVLTAPDQSPLIPLKPDDLRSVWRVPMPGGGATVLKLTPHTPRQRVQVALGMSQLQRQWRGADWLIRHEIPVARPWAIGRARFNNLHVQWLLLEHIEGRTLLSELARVHAAPASVPLAVQAAWAEASGLLIARLLALGKYNRDHKPSNFIAAPAAPGALIGDLTMIDTVAIRPIARWRGGPGPRTACARMLAALYIEAAGCNVPPRATLAFRTLRALAMAELAAAGVTPTPYPRFRRALRAVIRTAAGTAAELISTHGPAAPRVFPSLSQ